MQTMQHRHGRDGFDGRNFGGANGYEVLNGKVEAKEHT
jgi:hypothetical protein